jgi:hypothetical protein
MSGQYELSVFGARAQLAATARSLFVEQARKGEEENAREDGEVAEDETDGESDAVEVKERQQGSGEHVERKEKTHRPPVNMPILTVEECKAHQGLLERVKRAWRGRTLAEEGGLSLTGEGDSLRRGRHGF